jgi:hypothetical protein
MRWRCRRPPNREAASGTVGHATHWSPPMQVGGDRSHSTCDDARALSIREAGSRATGHKATPEPSLAERQGPEPLDTRQRRSPLYQRGKV